MKAVVHHTYGPPDVLHLEDVDPPSIGADDVLVRVHAASVDPGFWHLMTGLPYLVRPMFGFKGPKDAMKRADAAGVVEAVGVNVTRFRPGDRVFGTCDGSFAEYARARQDKLAAIPADTGFEQAAATPVSGITALQAIRDAGRVRPGQHVLVIGAAGGVGSFAVQLAKAFEAEVTGLCSGPKTDLVRSIGADHVLDYTSASFPDPAHRYDVILETAGDRPLGQLRRALTPRGTLVMIGGAKGGRWFGGMDRQLRAVLLSPLVGPRLRPLLALPREGDLDGLREYLEQGMVTPVIDRSYPLSEVPEAVRYVGQGHASGKVIITMPAVE